MEFVRLDQYCNAVKDGTHDTPKPVEEGMPLVTSKAINNNSIDYSQTYNISQKDYQQINRRSLVQKWDILMTMIGSVGRLLLVQDEPRYAIKNIALFKIDDEVKSKWLYYYLSQNTIQDYFQAIANGTSQHFIPLKDLRSFKVIPLNNDSHRIVSILSAYDSQIENNQKRIKLLEQMAENLYKEWFVRFRFPGFQTAEFEGGVPRGWNSQAGHNKKPKGWEYGELKKLGSFARGKNITSAEMIEGNIPVISAGLEPSGYHNAANVSGPCLTISSSGANAGYLKYNLTDIWAADCSYYNNPENVWFVYSALKYLQPVISNMQCGSAQPHVYPKDVNRLCVVLPPPSLVKTFNQQCQVIFDEILNVNKQIDTLTTQRDLLLPRLMSGKLSI